MSKINAEIVEKLRDGSLEKFDVGVCRLECEKEEIIVRGEDEKVVGRVNITDNIQNVVNKVDALILQEHSEL